MKLKEASGQELRLKYVSIYREEVDKEQDRLLWQQEIEEEVEETKEEYEREFRRKMLTYEEEMAKYQKQQQAKVRVSCVL